MKGEGKENSHSGKKPKKDLQLSPSAQFSALVRISSSAPVPTEGMTPVQRLLARPYPPKVKNEDELAWDRYQDKIRKKERLSQEEWDDILRIRCGQGRKAKEHPQRWAVHEFVENKNALEVEKASRVRKRCRKEMEKYREEIVEYFREALEKSDYEGIQTLVKMLEKAKKKIGMPFETSALVKARQVIFSYYAGQLLSVPGRVRRGENGETLPPTREDLEKLLPESDRSSIGYIVKKAKDLGNTIKKTPPWGSTK